MEPSKLDDIVLALLFASEEPLTTKRIASIVEDVTAADINQSALRLKERFQKEESSIVLERVAGGLQLATNPAYAEYLSRLYSGRRKQRLSKAAMETLAIIAYKQPITRLDIEQMRGVGCGGVVTTLMERSLIKIVGKAKVLGAPFLYGTTAEFLEYLGLNSLKDLPSIEELEALLEKEEAERLADTAPASDGSADATEEDADDSGAPEDAVDDDVDPRVAEFSDGPEVFAGSGSTGASEGHNGDGPVAEEPVELDEADAEPGGSTVEIEITNDEIEDIGQGAPEPVRTTDESEPAPPEPLSVEDGTASEAEPPKVPHDKNDR